MDQRMNDRLCTSVRSALVRRVMVGLALLGAVALGACIPDVVIPTCPTGKACAASDGGAGSAFDAGGDSQIGSGAIAGADSGGDEAGSRSAGGGGSVMGAAAGDGVVSGAGGDTASGGAADGGVPSGGVPSGGAPSGGGGATTTGGAGGAGGGLFVTPAELPAPCSAQPYSVTLNVAGGAGPYQWSVNASTGTWHIVPQPSSPDQSKVTLVGDGSGALLKVVVNDASVHRGSYTYTLTPRSSCYFAYVAADAGQGKLHLLDPLLGVLPVTLLNNAGVFDFKFSPDGRFLAYRFGQSSAHLKGAHLSLVDLEKPQDQQLFLGEDEVTAFAWSSDSRTLAVALRSSNVSYLGGVHLQTPVSSSVQVQTLRAVPANVALDVSWFASNYVAFYGPSSGPVLLSNLTDPYFAALTPNGFTAPLELKDLIFDSPLVIKTNDVGFYATGVTAAAGSKFYWPTDQQYDLTDHNSDYIAPSGHFTAELNDDLLQIRGAEQQPSESALVTSTPNAGCPRFLTWAVQRERIACVANVDANGNVPAHSEIRIFDLGSAIAAPLTMYTVQGYCPAPGSGTTQTCGATQYAYTEGNALLQTRLFSPSGRWLAVTKVAAQSSDNILYLADLSQNPMAVVRNDSLSVPGTAAGPVVLAFSGDEQFLLKQQGSLLTLHSLSAPQVTDAKSQIAVSMKLVLDPKAGSSCNEDFATNPQQWCGASDRARPFQWSPDSKLYAYRSLDDGVNHLTIASVGSFPDVTTYPHVANDCAGACSGDFAFQP